MFFEAMRVVQDTWHLVSGLRGVTCQYVSKSNNELKCGPYVTCGIMSLEGNLY